MKVKIIHFKILTFQNYYYMNKIELTLKYIKSFEKIEIKKENIIKAMYK